MIRIGIFIILIGLGLLYLFEITEESEAETNQALEEVEVNRQQPETYTEASEELTPENEEEKIEVIKGEEE